MKIGIFFFLSGVAFAGVGLELDCGVDLIQLARTDCRFTPILDRLNCPSNRQLLTREINSLAGVLLGSAPPTQRDENFALHWLGLQTRLESAKTGSAYTKPRQLDPFFLEDEEDLVRTLTEASVNRLLEENPLNTPFSTEWMNGVLEGVEEAPGILIALPPADVSQQATLAATLARLTEYQRYPRVLAYSPEYDVGLEASLIDQTTRVKWWPSIHFNSLPKIDRWRVPHLVLSTGDWIQGGIAVRELIEGRFIQNDRLLGFLSELLGGKKDSLRITLDSRLCPFLPRLGGTRFQQELVKLSWKLLGSAGQSPQQIWTMEPLPTRIGQFRFFISFLRQTDQKKVTLEYRYQ